MHAHSNLVKPNNEPRFVATCNEYTHLSEDCVCVYVRNVSMIIRNMYEWNSTSYRMTILLVKTEKKEADRKRVRLRGRIKIPAMVIPLDFTFRNFSVHYDIRLD